MLTLSYGIKKPESNDRGPVVFPALEANFQQQNDHDHNGVNSAQIQSASIAKTTQNVLAVNWVSLGGGHFKQTVTLPGILEYDNVTLTFKLTTGEIVYPTVKKASTTQYEIYFDDATQDLKVLIN